MTDSPVRLDRATAVEGPLATEGPVTLDSLLAHAAWLRALSRHLVGDAAADDLVQDVWLQAASRPPRELRSPRRWLASVLRHSHRRRALREAARREREDDTARPEASPSTAELAERAEAQRWLVEAVLTLEDPWRRTVLLHFFEGSSAAAIARRDGVSASTVRTRIARGVQLLRERLDARPGGRESWLSGVALLAFAPRRASAAGLLASASVPVLSVAMWKAVTAALSLVFVAWLAVVAFDGDTARPLEPRVPEPDAAQALATIPSTADPLPVDPVERASVAPEATPDPLPEAAAAPRADNAIVGRVLDPWGKPIDGARVRNGTFHEIYLRQNSDRGGSGLMAESDLEGRFRLVVPDELLSEETSLLISAHHDVHAASQQVEVPLAALASSDGLELRLRRGASVRGTVYGIDEQPVEGRGVTLAAPELNAFRRLTTDADGRFETQGLIPAAWRAATFPDEDELAAAGVGTDAQTQVSYLAQREFQLEAGESIEIDLGRPSPDSPRIVGTVISKRGPASTLVQWFPARRPTELMASTLDDSGRFEATLPEPGRWVAFANMADPSSRGLRFVYDFEPGESREIEIVLDGARVQGRVVDASGEPLDRVRVELRSEGTAPHRPIPTGGKAVDYTEDGGHYHFDLVQPGQWSVVVHGRDIRRKSPDVAAIASAPFEVDEADVTLDDIVTSDGARVAVRVVDERGEPVREASVWFHDDQGRPLNPYNDSSTNKEGRSTSPLLPIGRVAISATIRSGAAPPRTVDVGVADELELVLRSPKYIEVLIDPNLDPITTHWRLTDADGRRWLGLFDRRRIFDSRPEREDPGRPLLGPLPLGTYTLEVDGRRETVELTEASSEVTSLRFD